MSDNDDEIVRGSKIFRGFSYSAYALSKDKSETRMAACVRPLHFLMTEDFFAPPFFTAAEIQKKLALLNIFGFGSKNREKKNLCVFFPSSLSDNIRRRRRRYRMKHITSGGRKEGKISIYVRSKQSKVSKRQVFSMQCRKSNIIQRE